MAEASRDVKLIAEIRKHNRMIKDAYRYYSIDAIFGQLPADAVEYLHECGTADKILLENAEAILNE
jgi:hypothetical protein